MILAEYAYTHNNNCTFIHKALKMSQERRCAFCEALDVKILSDVRYVNLFKPSKR